MDQGEGKVLVEEVAKELAHANVRPATMYQQEALKETKLCEGIVTGHDGLHALLSTDADTYSISAAAKNDSMMIMWRRGVINSTAL